MIIGLHVYKGDFRNWTDAIAAAKDYIQKDSDGALILGAIQIFTHGPRNTKESKMVFGDIIKATGDSHLYVHATYLSNIWKESKFIYDHVINEFAVANKINARGVVLHIPKKLPAEIARGVKVLYDDLYQKKINTPIILEMTAVKPDKKSYESPEKIDNLIEEMKKIGITNDRVGICIDTAHIYASGQNIRKYGDAKEYLSKIKNIDWIKLIHLNGNKVNNKEKCRDEHIIPICSRDQIWRAKKYADSGCKCFIDFCKNSGLDFILEISDYEWPEIKDMIKI